MEQIDTSMVKKAIDSLLDYQKTKGEEKQAQKGKISLFDDDINFLNVQISLKKITDTNRTSPYQILLPHSIYGSPGMEICLFTKDPEEEYSQDKGIRSISNIKEVMGISRLRSDFGSFVSKRELCSQYSLFLSDDRIIPLLPPLLGRTFFKQKKHPAPVSLLGNRHIELLNAINSTYLFLSNGTSCMYKFALSSFSLEESTENLLSSLPTAISHIPYNWENIQAIYIKTSNSPSLPIYLSIPKEKVSIQSIKKQKVIASNKTNVKENKKESTSKRPRKMVNKEEPTSKRPRKVAKRAKK